MCDEIEGKYGKWDENARNEAQDKVDKLGRGGLPVEWEEYQNSIPGYTRISTVQLLNCEGEPVKVFDGTRVLVGLTLIVIAVILAVGTVPNMGTSGPAAYGTAAAGFTILAGGTYYGAHELMAAGGDCGDNDGERDAEKTPNQNPKDFNKMRGNQGWRDRDGNTWKKDKLHKDYWDVSNSKGKKIREVDFNGREICQMDLKIRINKNYLSFMKLELVMKQSRKT